MRGVIKARRSILVVCIFLSCLGAFANPIIQKDVYFDNQSAHAVYVLPEVGGKPIKVLAHTKIIQPMDAFADPEWWSAKPGLMPM